MRESTIEKHLVDSVKKMGGWALKIMPTVVNGLPDRLCLLPGGRIFFVETKATGETARPLQKLIHRKLVKLGFKVYVPDSIEKINLILKSYEN